MTLGSGCKVASFQVFFNLSAPRVSRVLDFHLIYVIVKPTVSEDTGLISSLVLCKLPIMLTLKQPWQQSCLTWWLWRGWVAERGLEEPRNFCLLFFF